METEATKVEGEKEKGRSVSLGDKLHQDRRIVLLSRGYFNKSILIYH